jgi:dihydrodipicolinate synthase/N-acetylneuraminate lyase
MIETKFSGVFVATITPYSALGAVDAGVARELTRWIAGHGVRGICPAGTTGEFPLLTREEKALAGRAACEGAGDRAKVVAGIWGATAEERAWLAKQAEASGAAAVFLTVPYFFASPPAYLLEWYRGVRRATSLPVFAYNIPQCTANEIPLEVLDTLAGEGTIQGYKDSSHDPARLEAVVKLLKGRIAVFGGSEGLFARARELGADGLISGVANVYPKTVLAVWQGDRAAVDRLARIKTGLQKHGTFASLKYVLTLRGMAVGAPREPIAPVTDAGKKDLEALEKEFGKDF